MFWPMRWLGPQFWTPQKDVQPIHLVALGRTIRRTCTTTLVGGAFGAFVYSDRSKREQAYMVQN